MNKILSLFQNLFSLLPNVCFASHLYQFKSFCENHKIFFLFKQVFLFKVIISIGILLNFIFPIYDPQIFKENVDELQKYKENVDECRLIKGMQNNVDL